MRRGDGKARQPEVLLYTFDRYPQHESRSACRGMGHHGTQKAKAALRQVRARPRGEPRDAARVLTDEISWSDEVNFYPTVLCARHRGGGAGEEAASDLLSFD